MFAMEAALLDRHVRPDVIDQFLLCDHLTRAVGKIDQDIQRPTAEGKHLTVAPEYPLADREFERAELQLPMNCAAKHVSAKMTDFPRPICLSSVGRCRNCACVKLATTKLVGFPQPLERTN
jgi:hypothetical protein